MLRWNRVLAALGEEVAAGVSPMTVAEAKTNESRYMRSRWARVTATLEAIETRHGGTGGPGSSGGKYAALIKKMYEWRNDPQWAHQKAHTDR